MTSFKGRIFIVDTGAPARIDLYTPQETKDLYKWAKGYDTHEPSVGGPVATHGSICAAFAIQAYPDARIEHVRCLDQDGAGTMEYFKAALEEVLKLLEPDERAVINCSLGVTLPPGTQFDDMRIEPTSFAKGRFVNVFAVHAALHIPIIDEIEALLKQLKDRGCVIVVAAGNEGTFLSYPASSPHVIPIGCEQDYVDGDGQPHAVLSDFSNTGCWFTMDGDDEITYSWREVSRGSGTSYAAPKWAGWVARIWSDDPSMSLDTIIGACRMRAYCKHAPKQIMPPRHPVKGFGSNERDWKEVVWDWNIHK